MESRLYWDGNHNRACHTPNIPSKELVAVEESMTKHERLFLTNDEARTAVFCDYWYHTIYQASIGSTKPLKFRCLVLIPRQQCVQSQRITIAFQHKSPTTAAQEQQHAHCITQNKRSHRVPIQLKHILRSCREQSRAVCITPILLYAPKRQQKNKTSKHTHKRTHHTGQLRTHLKRNERKAKQQSSKLGQRHRKIAKEQGRDF